MNTMNATVATTLVESELSSGVWEMIRSVEMELLLFVVAMIGYFALFMVRTPKNSKLHVKKMKVVDDCKEDDYPTDSYANNKVQPQDCASMEKALRQAFENGDYRSVLRCWNTIKKIDQAPSLLLPQVVESMQRFKKDTPFILRELKDFLQKRSTECSMSCVNDLLESLAKRLDSDLVEKIVEMLPSVNLKIDERSYEVLLNMYFTTRNFQDVQTLVSQMKAEAIPFTARSSMVVIKTALKVNNLNEAFQHFRDLKASWSSQSDSHTASMAPGHIVSQMIDLACKEHKLSEFVSELRGMELSEEMVNKMLAECVQQRDSILAESVVMMARDQKVNFTDTTYGLLIKSIASDPVKVRSLFDEVLEKGIQLTSEFAVAVLGVCAQTSNVEMAEKLYEYMKPEQMSVLSAFVRFYAECEEYEKACDVYEHDIMRVHGPTENGTSAGGSRLQLDPRLERSLMSAALKCGRGHLAKNLLSASPSDIAKHVTMIRNCAASKNLKGAVSVFEELEQSGIELNSIIYNTVLDACVECRDLKAAEAWMERMQKVHMTDVVSFNTLIKAHLQNGNFNKARCLMEEMKAQELQPNRVTFNELLNAMVARGGSVRRKQLWDLVDEMSMADVKPNQVTISILLKSLNYYSGEEEILKTMALVKAMDEPMDEVLLSSIVEACVRIGKVDLLESQLKHLQDSAQVSISGSHTYGSLIKAYGHAKDIDGIWRCWKEMRNRHIKPTSITLGCMVEAIVNNGDTEGAFDLIHEMQEDEQCSGAVNSVVYCSVLKGFAREKKMDRVWSVYKEMSDKNIELSVIMYNTLIDACARCGRMDYLPKILEDMKVNKVEPNIVTYSTMLKGQCQSGNVQAGFSILEQVKKEPGLKPDEIMYNSLLDGCTQNSLVDEGLRLLQEMQSEGVQPSNFTLSILVKLMNRARRLDQAFALVEEITKKYHFQPNLYVYTNLVQACISNQQLPRGMSLLEQMVKERILPDGRTYAILVRASLFKGLYEQAAGLLRGALGLPNALPFLQDSRAVCWNLDHAIVNETLSSLAEGGHAKDLAVPLLSAIKDHAPKVHIDAATQRRVMSPCLPSDGGRPRFGKGKGKGLRDDAPWRQNRQ